MEKVYVIRYEDLCSGKYSSGTSYVFDSLEKAEIMLRQIKQDEICSSERKDIQDLTKDFDDESGFIIDYLDDYTKYVIEEMEVQ
jgi:hypothetical protein